MNNENQNNVQNNQVPQQPVEQNPVLNVINQVTQQPTEQVIDVSNGAKKKDGQVVCPNCGASEISPNPKTGKLRCDYCACEFDGKKVENIIFVKEGRLILEAAINLNNPSESYEKYFRENFKTINLKTLQRMRNSVSQTETSAIDYKQLENNNYLNYLEEKLKDQNLLKKT